MIASRRPSGPRSSASTWPRASGSSSASASVKRSSANVNGGIVSSAGLVSGNAAPQMMLTPAIASTALWVLSFASCMLSCAVSIECSPFGIIHQLRDHL
jgi:hypothetical protein